MIRFEDKIDLQSHGLHRIQFIVAIRTVCQFVYLNVAGYVWATGATGMRVK